MEIADEIVQVMEAYFRWIQKSRCISLSSAEIHARLFAYESSESAKNRLRDGRIKWITSPRTTGYKKIWTVNGIKILNITKKGDT